MPTGTTFAEILTAAAGIVTDLNLMPVIAAGAVAGVFAYLIRRASKRFVRVNALGRGLFSAWLIVL